MFILSYRSGLGQTPVCPDTGVCLKKKYILIKYYIYVNNIWMILAFVLILLYFFFYILRYKNSWFNHTDQGWDRHLFSLRQIWYYFQNIIDVLTVYDFNVCIFLFFFIGRLTPERLCWISVSRFATHIIVWLSLHVDIVCW